MIGIVGGVASGKSLVAEQLASVRAPVVLDADQAGHEVLRTAEVKQRRARRWGDGDFRRGRPDRSRGSWRKIVFAPAPEGPRELKYLEQLTHPRIGQLLRAADRRNWPRPADVPAVVLDAPLLFEGRLGRVLR